MSFLYSFLALIRHWHFLSHAWDLGIFDQVIWHYSRFEVPACTIRGFANILGDHFSPINALLAPFYWVLPHVEVILVIQAILFMLPLFPIYFFTEKRLGRGPAAIFCAVYSFFWGIQAAGNVDYHEICFAVPLIAFALYFIDEERWKSFSICALLLTLVKEDMCVYVGFLGLFLIWLRHFKRGFFWTLFGFGMFFLEIKIAIPFFKGSPGYDYWTYSQIGSGPLDALKNCLTHPWIVPMVVFSNKLKITTVFCTYFAYLFIPFLSPISILTLPSILERMLNDQNWMWLIQAHQYSAVISPILALSAADGLFRFLKHFRLEAERKKWLTGFCALLITINVAAIPLEPLGKVFFDPYYLAKPTYLTGDQALKLIPDGASVIAQETTVSHLSHRKLIWRMDEDSLLMKEDVDYIVACQHLDLGQLHKFEEIEQYLKLKERKGYEKIFDQDGWIILKRKNA